MITLPCADAEVVAASLIVDERDVAASFILSVVGVLNLDGSASSNLLEVSFYDITSLAVFYGYDSHIGAFVDVEWSCVKIAVFVRCAAI